MSSFRANFKSAYYFIVQKKCYEKCWLETYLFHTFLHIFLPNQNKAETEVFVLTKTLLSQFYITTNTDLKNDLQ